MREIPAPCGLTWKYKGTRERRSEGGCAKRSFRIGYDPGMTGFPDPAAFSGTDPRGSLPGPQVRGTGGTLSVVFGASKPGPPAEHADTPAFKHALRQRRKVEAQLGELKNQIGLGRLRLRRVSFAREQFFLAATAQNIRRLVRFLNSQPQLAAAVPASKPISSDHLEVHCLPKPTAHPV